MYLITYFRDTLNLYTSVDVFNNFIGYFCVSNIEYYLTVRFKGLLVWVLHVKLNSIIYFVFNLNGTKRKRLKFKSEIHALLIQGDYNLKKWNV